MSEEDILIQIPDYESEPLMVANSQSVDWGVQKLCIPDIWKNAKGEGITVLVLDTGCPGVKENGVVKIHPDLINNVIVDKCKSFVNEDIWDMNGHGTACAGVIAAEDNELGFVGYAPKAKIISYKVLGANGSGSLNGIAGALEAALDLKPDIVSMSLGATTGTARLQRAVEMLDREGIPCICAAGNGGAAEAVNYPAKYQQSFAIGAFDRHGKIANFSAIGNEMDFAFPGVDIQTTWLKNGYTKISGTSFACPACAGVVALLMSRDIEKAKSVMRREKNTMWVYRQLKRYAINPVNVNMRTSDWGWGYIDIPKLFSDREIYTSSVLN